MSDIKNYEYKRSIEYNLPILIIKYNGNIEHYYSMMKNLQYYNPANNNVSSFKNCLNEYHKYKQLLKNITNLKEELKDTEWNIDHCYEMIEILSRYKEDFITEIEEYENKIIDYKLKRKQLKLKIKEKLNI